jgi:hypothetical protein
MNKTVTIFFSIIMLTGCASITGSTTQNISVETRSDSGVISGAECELTNAKGKWLVRTPGSTVVQRSNDDLIALCNKKGYSPGQQKLISTTKGSMFGNILLGGGIGAIVDHKNGSAYEYPSLVQIFMIKNLEGAENEIESPTQQNGAIKSIQKISPDVAKAKCSELGFISGTEDFAKCVLRLGK